MTPQKIVSNETSLVLPAQDKRGRGRPRKVKPDEAEQLQRQQKLQELSSRVYTEEDVRELRRLKRRDEYLGSFLEFFMDAFPHIEGGTYVPTWHVPYLCNRLERAARIHFAGQDREANLDVNIPPRCLKSMIISVAFPVWFWLHKPNAAILSVSSNVEMAKKMLAFSKNIMRSNWFKLYFPEHAELAMDNATEIQNNFKGSRRALGVGTKVLGANADLILSDDVMDTDTALSDVERKAVVERVSGAFYGRLNDKQVGLIINIQQRLHVEDLSGYLRSNMGEYWEVIKLPSEAKTPDDVMPAEWFYRYDNETNAAGEVVGKLLSDLKGKLSRKDLEFEKKRIGSLAYAQQHLQSPRAAEGGMFKTKWFDNLRISWSAFQERVKGKSLQWQVFVDGAETDNPERDPTCIMLCAKCDNQLYIRQVQNVHKRITDLVTHLNNYLSSLSDWGIKVARVLVEDKSIGQQLIDIMRKSTQTIPFVALSTNNEPKYVRANRAVPFVEGGKMLLIQEEPGVPSWIQDFIDQVTAFTNGKGTKHDDAVDTMAYAIANASQNKVWM